MRRFRRTIRDPETLRGAKRRRGGVNFDVTMDFHGYRAEEALRELEEELLSLEAGSILVIHGKGDGILRRRIREFLSERSGDFEVENGEDANLPGGDGVTVVYLNCRD
ncbi:MAG: Smr/MutS family protein [Victivallales bacterium]|nr:Smr/MutS family protein [Victivallales bacterium]